MFSNFPTGLILVIATFTSCCLVWETRSITRARSDSRPGTSTAANRTECLGIRRAAFNAHRLGRATRASAAASTRRRIFEYRRQRAGHMLPSLWAKKSFGAITAIRVLYSCLVLTTVCGLRGLCASSANISKPALRLYLLSRITCAPLGCRSTEEPRDSRHLLADSQIRLGIERCRSSRR